MNNIRLNIGETDCENVN